MAAPMAYRSRRKPSPLPRRRRRQRNRRAQALYEKVGFRPVGILREYERGPDGSWHDGLLMDMLCGELCP